MTWSDFISARLSSAGVRSARSLQALLGDAGHTVSRQTAWRWTTAPPPFEGLQALGEVLDFDPLDRAVIEAWKTASTEAA